MNYSYQARRRRRDSLLSSGHPRMTASGRITDIAPFDFKTGKPTSVDRCSPGLNDCLSET